MRIKKTSETRALAGKVVNTNSNSTTDTYSCDYINKLDKVGKLLWSGSFAEGTITVPGLSDYSLLVVSLSGGINCIGNRTWGIGGIGAYASYNIQIYGYRFSSSGDTLTIDNVCKGGSDGTQNVPVVAIRGLY